MATLNEVVEFGSTVREEGCGVRIRTLLPEGEDGVLDGLSHSSAAAPRMISSSTTITIGPSLLPDDVPPNSGCDTGPAPAAYAGWAAIAGPAEAGLELLAGIACAGGTPGSLASGEGTLVTAAAGALALAEAFSRRVPHPVQNTAPGSIVALQAGHCSLEGTGLVSAFEAIFAASAACSGNRVPQLVQKTASVSTKAPHFGHELGDMMA
jgi:hypothetical protein